MQAGLAPGINLWQSLMPGRSKRNQDNPQPPSESDPSGGDPEQGSGEGASQLELAQKLAAMEQRLKQLEGDAADDANA